MSPTGILTGADQEGNWMPATRIDEYKQGGFYGDMRAHHRNDAAEDLRPAAVLAAARGRQLGRRAGVGAGRTTFGPLAGLPLHLSYGRCKAFVLLRQELGDGLVQGGARPLGLTFLSGVCRGRFGPGRAPLRLRAERLADRGAGRRLLAARPLHRASRSTCRSRWR